MYMREDRKAKRNTYKDTEGQRQTEVKMWLHEKTMPWILEEIPLLWVWSQTSLGWCEKCECLHLTGWKNLSGAMIFFFPWGGTCVVSLKSFSSRRCWKFREKAGATGFLETYFMVQNQGTAFIWDTFLQETWDAVRWFCYFSPYNVNGPKLIRNQKLTCHW